MVIFVSITKFPYQKSKEIAQKFIEVSQKFPVNRELEKPLLRMAARIIGDKIETIAVAEIKEGKEKAFLQRNLEIQMEYFDFDGMEFNNFVYSSGMDAMSLVGLEMPK